VIKSGIRGKNMHFSLPIRINRLKEIFQNIRASKKPVKFLWGYFLKRTGICRIFKINLPGFSIRFYPSVLSWLIWVDPGLYNNEFSFLERYLKSGDIVIDVGANIGLITLAASTRVGENGQVYAFEPHPGTFEFLKGNIEINHSSNVLAYQVAAGERTSSTVFDAKSVDDCQNSLIMPEDLSNEEDIIRVEPLDAIIPEKIHVNLLKIDAEGYEKFILLGAERVMKDTECIYIESYELHFKRFGYSTKDLIAILEHSDFHTLKCVGDELFAQVGSDYISDHCENLVAVKNLTSFLTKTRYRLSSN